VRGLSPSGLKILADREAIMRIISLAACLCATFVLQSPASAQAPIAIRIGILNDQAGPYADFGGKTSVTAAQMAVEDFGGKVLGQYSAPLV
jgi:branched-chain amino acid transport system substrate-binding protein